MSKNPRIPFPPVQHAYAAEEIAAVVAVMQEAGPKSGPQTQGPRLAAFEAAFRSYIGARHAFAVDNGTNALHLAATLCRLEPGDEVIVPGYTYCATAIPFAARGARIVWADIHPTRWNISAEDIERKITPRTKVIVAVHLLGMPCDMKEIMALAKRRGLLVVEDCAQALGAAIDGQVVGSFGDFGCFSFHSQKAMTTLGEGGMLTVASDADAALVETLRFNGVCDYEGERERYWMPAMSNVDLKLPGAWPYNFCIGEAQCALGTLGLARVDGLNAVLTAQGARIRAALADLPEIAMHEIPAGYRHVHHQCVLRYDGAKWGKTREDLLDILTGENEMRVIVQYHPLYRYDLFKDRGFGEASCPDLDWFWDRSFSLPWWNGMDDATVDDMVACVRKAVLRLREG